MFGGRWQSKYVACRYCVKIPASKTKLKKLKMRVSFLAISEETSEE